MTDEQSRQIGGIDWLTLKTKFINGTMSLKDLADEHSIKEGTIRSRAKREDWQRERNELQLIATQTVNELNIADKVDLLAKLNETDLSAAESLRAKANELLATVATAAELKALSGTFDVAQKISRLALGASTENSTVTTKELPASVDEFV
jgi:predicted  nucleic acid-binding Zn-ribbon protein